MFDRINFLVKDSLCHQATEDFKILKSMQDWLNEYSDLFSSVTLKPEGLPRITLAYFENETFKNIKKFAHLYEKVLSTFD